MVRRKNILLYISLPIDVKIIWNKLTFKLGWLRSSFLLCRYWNYIHVTMNICYLSWKEKQNQRELSQKVFYQTVSHTLTKGRQNKKKNLLKSKKGWILRVPFSHSLGNAHADVRRKLPILVISENEEPGVSCDNLIQLNIQRVHWKKASWKS